MNKRKLPLSHRIKTVLSLFCTLALLVLILTPVVQAEEMTIEPEAGVKSEVVYATLEADGQVKDMYVVNSFGPEGAEEITDYGDYSSVESLALSGTVKQEGDRVKVSKLNQNYYYKGKLDQAQLPWNIKLTHKLEGTEVSAKDMAGKSGAWELEITISKNSDIKENPWADNLMLQISLNLADKVAKDIQTNNGMIAKAGSHNMLNFMMMPDSDQMTFQTTAQVENFELPALQIAGVEFSLDMLQFELPDLSDNEELNKLEEATKLLADGSQEFFNGLQELNQGNGELTDGLDALVTSGTGLKDGGDALQVGLAEYTNGLGILALQSQNMVNGANQLMTAAEQIKTGFAGLSQGGQEVIDGSSQIQTGIADMQIGLADLDIDQLKATLVNLQEMQKVLPVLSQELAGLNENLNKLKAGIDYLVAGIQAYQGSVSKVTILTTLGLDENQLMTDGNMAALGILNYIEGTNTQGLKPIVEGLVAIQTQLAEQLNNPGLANMQAGLEALANLPDMSNFSGLLENLGGLVEFNTQYSAFHTGLSAYVNGVNDFSKAYYQAGSTNNFYSGLTAYLSGSSQFAAGVGQLNTYSSDLNKGLISYNSGAKQYVEGLGTWANGYAQVSDGIGQLIDPARKLADGNKQLAVGAANMDVEMNRMINEILADYEDFKPVPSFASRKNAQPATVQFVMMTDAINLEDIETNQDQIVETKKSIWDRFIDLFRFR